MFINEVSKLTKLTKKQSNITLRRGCFRRPSQKNGYRAYSGQDIARLEKIRVLRKLDIATEEIKQILDDKTNAALRTVAVKKSWNSSRTGRNRPFFKSSAKGAHTRT